LLVEKKEKERKREREKKLICIKSSKLNSNQINQQVKENNIIISMYIGEKITQDLIKRK
jgi:hypothetical protein